jgi:hypothetical protein
MNFRRRRLHKWTIRSRPHLQRFNQALNVISGARPSNLIGAADQLGAAANELARYLALDPCPVPEMTEAHDDLIAITLVLAATFSRWDRMVRGDRTEAVEFVRALGERADHVAEVLGPLP